MNSIEHVPQVADLESVITTDELERRPSRPPNHAAENSALVGLAQAMASSPQSILKKLADVALDLCRAQSAGISLLEEDGKNFCWPAVAGEWTSQVGGGTPREFGPCGTVLDRNAAQLMSHPERHFPYIGAVTPLIEEVLLIPFYVEGKAVGTIWVISHEQGRRFDAEDLRIMNKLGTFAASGYQVLKSLARHNRDDAMRASLAAIVESSEDAIVSKDLDGIICSWNRGAQELFGYTAEEAIGQSVTMLIPPECLDEEPRILDRVRRGERIQHFETVRRRKDGTKIDISLRVSPIVDGQHRIVGASKTARDITARKRKEEELSNSDRRKTEFLALLAHELRNPLAPLANAVQIMRIAGGGEEKVLSACAMMDRQVGQMVRLVDDLLDVSRINRGKIELRTEILDLASAVSQAVESCRPALEGLGQELTITWPLQHIYLHGESARVSQVVGNLLHNASKFTEKGGRIWLTIEREAHDAVIRVRDSGVGIAADQLSAIFEMFTQLDSSLEQSQGGLGLGLALVKTLVEMHGGTVTASSGGVGRGSEFVVRLPTVSETPEVQPPQPTVSEPRQALPLRILVVDDNRDSAESLAELLKLTGNETHIAYDGLEAVEAAAALLPHVVILDIGMPRLNGYEAARRIRERSGGDDIVLVALTGWGQEEDRQKSVDAGFNAHMVKPISFDDLTRVLGAAS
ncbi:MAG: PAS domain S-box protein [Casimicrobiaceae bacterium]